jgi:hypothetical protein
MKETEVNTVIPMTENHAVMQMRYGKTRQMRVNRNYRIDKQVTTYGIR